MILKFVTSEIVSLNFILWAKIPICSYPPWSVRGHNSNTERISQYTTLFLFSPFGSICKSDHSTPLIKQKTPLDIYLCTCQRASWTYPPQVFTTIHLFNKIVSQDSPSVHLFSKTIGSRFTIAKIKFGEDSPSWFVSSRSRFTLK